MIVVGSAAAEPLVQTFPRLALLVGDASYTVYLTHFASLSLFCIFGIRFNYFHADPLTIFCIFSLTAIALGIIAHLVIERPLLRLLGNRTWQAFPSGSATGARDQPAVRDRSRQRLQDT